MPSAIAINCSLKRSAGDRSSTDRLIDEVMAALEMHGIDCKPTIRIADHDIKPGVENDMGDGDEWPRIRNAILSNDILVFGSPIWLGHLSSMAQKVLERFDALLSEIDDAGRTPATGKIAVVAVVGNEDGAHHVSASLMQGLNDVGFTIPAMGAVYWVGEAMQRTDYKDLPATPDKVAEATRSLAANAAHLSELLAERHYRGVE